MSFSLTALGNKADVIAQLNKQAESTYIKDTEGASVAEYLTGLLSADSPDTYSVAGEYRYMVEASGHQGGGSGLYLNASVRAFFVPATPADDGDSISGDTTGTDSAPAASARAASDG